MILIMTGNKLMMKKAAPMIKNIELRNRSGSIPAPASELTARVSACRLKLYRP
jgi:hypothetical protein